MIKTSIFSIWRLFYLNNSTQKARKHQLKISQATRLARMVLSPQFEQGKAINKMPQTPYQGSKILFHLKSFFNRKSLKFKEKIPQSKLDINALKKRSKALRITWLGHSSLFIEINKTRILIDPVFGFASPFIAKPWFGRNIKTPITKDQLPSPDVIIISHDHYDHLEKSTIRYFSNKSVLFFVPLGVGRHLENWGVSPDKIKEFDWWESITINSITITSTPANHNSGRTGFDSNKTLWCSWAFQSKQGSAFFSGDSAYGEHFKDIRRRLGQFDVVFIEVAANAKKATDYPVENCGHMQACHTIKAFQDLGATNLFPVHWSTFELFVHQWDEPITDLLQEAERVNACLITPMIGEIILLQEQHNINFWWMNIELSTTVINKRKYNTKLNASL